MIRLSVANCPKNCVIMSEKLEQMVVQLAESNAQLQQSLKDANETYQRDMAAAKAAQTAEIDRLVVALGGIANLPADNNDAIRAKNVLVMRKDFRKSTRCKCFSEKQDMRPKDWLRRFDAEIDQVRAMSGVPAPLTRDEWLLCFIDKLEFEAKERLQTAMALHKPAPLTWDHVTMVEIRELLLIEFDVKESKVSEVLQQFGQGRFRKPVDMGVAEWYHKFLAQLPPCFKPTTADENSEFVDLIRRSLFYLNLEDKGIQEELCKIKEDDQDLAKFLEESVKAEANRKAFEQIGTSGAQLCDSQVSVSLWESRPKQKAQGQPMKPL